MSLKRITSIFTVVAFMGIISLFSACDANDLSDWGWKLKDAAEQAFGTSDESQYADGTKNDDWLLPSEVPFSTPELGDSPMPTEKASDSVVKAYPGQLCLFAWMSYFPFPKDKPGATFLMFVDCDNKEFKDNVDEQRFADMMYGWRLLTTLGDISGLELAVYENQETYVLAIRGTQEMVDWLEHITYFETARRVGISSMPNANPQSPPLVRYLNNSLNSNPSGIAEYLESAKAIYVTGHSLGGYLSFVAADELCRLGYGGKLRQIVTFNGEGINPYATQWVGGDNFDYKEDFKDKVLRYYVEGDFVGDFPCDHVAAPDNEFDVDYTWKTGTKKHHMMNFVNYFGFPVAGQ